MGSCWMFACQSIRHIGNCKHEYFHHRLRNVTEWAIKTPREPFPANMAITGLSLRLPGHLERVFCQILRIRWPLKLLHEIYNASRAVVEAVEMSISKHSVIISAMESTHISMTDSANTPFTSPLPTRSLSLSSPPFPLFPPRAPPLPELLIRPVMPAVATNKITNVKSMATIRKTSPAIVAMRLLLPFSSRRFQAH
ncbi:hypothetical protein BAUCODRAFT_304132 [Baudoinia panamericana UAMH 10762]|uniref:Uncharacterized protein n=1 Tax=Baudoinia panamericana (strain UAMH 10762) TaxID=717646 RepID=M2MYM3_BAUPA|nr:uncharacterized protein BAUCODRAFT_304132 [Baudoinia panamericana UAMH 10762]EMC91764.1 hypothetical protein BAUCODRAFT_304132 [Baudoinia panamericana UAMH 10762]